MKTFKYLFFLSFLLFISCKSDEDTFIYQVNEVNVSQVGSDKQNVKSTNEFISIAYSDLFGTTISQGVLTDLALVYTAFGDKKMIEDLIIRNFLDEPGISIPSTQEMRSDVEAFVKSAFNKFFNRDPNELEAWQVAQIIEGDDSITPELVYYSFMTSNEYRYY